MLIAIAMVDRNWAMDSNGKQPIHLQKDLERFQHLTEGNLVIMGRKTLDNLPGGKPLRSRINVVLTRDTSRQSDPEQGLYYVHTDRELCDIMRRYKDRKHILIGGADLMNQFISVQWPDVIFITKVNIDFPNPSAILTNLDLNPYWYRIPSLSMNFMKDYDKSTGDSFNTEVVTYVRS